jgi:hypothetical protein
MSANIGIALFDQDTTKAHAIIMLVLHKDAWNIMLGNTRHVQVIRQNFMASTITNPCCCCDFIYHLGAVGTHQRCTFLDLVFSSDRSWPTSMLIIFQTLSPPLQNVCATYHSTNAQGFFAIHLLDHLKCFTSGFAQFLAELDVCLLKL